VRVSRYPASMLPQGCWLAQTEQRSPIRRRTLRLVLNRPRMGLSLVSSFFFGAI
jgi:hypothetical protein